MLTSLALIFLIGISMAGICKRIRLPRIIGMLATGIVLGPYVLDLLDASILGISSELRSLALVIILIKAGLSLSLADLKRVGRPAIMLSFVPATLELLAFFLLAPYFLPVTRLQAAIIGAVLGAVSPAVVIPKMDQLMTDRYGTDKRIPQLMIAGASLDDVFVIVLFYAFISMEAGGRANAMDFAGIPISIVLGILLGLAAGWLLASYFEWAFQKNIEIRNTMKLIVVLGTALLLMAIETWLKPYIAVSGLLAVMSMAMMITKKAPESVSARLAEKYGKLWLAAEVILFVLVGAAVDIRYTLGAGLGALIMILIGLIFRSIGVFISLMGTDLNRKERIFCVIAYIPKATVQAAIGGVPLSMGLSCGNIVLSVAVLSIILTAPLGAIGMDLTYQKLLHHEED